MISGYTIRNFFIRTLVVACLCLLPLQKATAQLSPTDYPTPLSCALTGGCDNYISFTTSLGVAEAAIMAVITAQGILIELAIEMAKGSIVGALRSHSESFQNSMVFLAKKIGQFMDAELNLERNYMKYTEDYYIKRDLAAPQEIVGTDANGKKIVNNMECSYLSSFAAGGMAGQMAQRDIQSEIANKGTQSFENRKRSQFGYGRAAAQRKMFNKWLNLWCVDTTNSGNVPEDCGKNRASENHTLKNLDLKISDLLFSGLTWPSADLIEAQNNLIFYLGIRPLNPFNEQDLDNMDIQAAYMERRRLLARKNLVDASLGYLAAKRQPVMHTGKYLRGIMRNIINPGENEIALQMAVDSIPDKVSFSQWSDIMQSKRLLSQHYFAETQKLNEGQAENEITRLMAMRMVQLRERYHIMERLLGVVAGDYAITIDTPY